MFEPGKMGSVEIWNSLFHNYVFERLSQETFSWKPATFFFE